MGCLSCGECMCHALGILIAAAGFVITVLAVILVSLFDYPAFWFKMGLGAFGVGGALGILFILYVCFAMQNRYKLFGCCGSWSDVTRVTHMQRLHEEKFYEEPKPNPKVM